MFAPTCLMVWLDLKMHMKWDLPRKINASVLFRCIMSSHVKPCDAGWGFLFWFNLMVQIHRGLDLFQSV